MNNNTVDQLTCILFILFFPLLISVSAYSLELPIAIHGEVKVLEIIENTSFANQTSTSKHYKGHVKGEEDDWVRISQLADGAWSGLVSTGGEMHFVENEAPKDRYAIESRAFSSIAEHPVCGLDHSHGHAHSIADVLKSQSALLSAGPQPSPAPAALQSALLVPQAIAADFTTACTGNIIDGTCVFADLQLVFDQEYQQALASDVQGNTDSIINMVEGYYLSLFNIAFNNINQVFLTDATDIYTSSNDASDVLDSVFSRRCEQQPASDFCRLVPSFDNAGTGPSSFLQNDDSIIHFVTGRDFAGTTAGVAFLGTLCSPTNVGTSNLSRNFGGGISLAFTAAIIAHEIGHNFGANHDGATLADEPGNTTITSANASSCASTGFVMAATLGPGLPAGFSTCSEETITQAMATNINNSSCATAPVDLTIASGSFSGTANVSDSIDIEDAFIVNPSQLGFLTTGNSEVMLSSTGATIETASIAGVACTVLSSTQQAICSLPVASSNSDIDMTVSVFDNTVNVSATDNTNALFRDTNRANSNAFFSFAALDTPVAPPSAPAPTTPTTPGSTSGSSESSGGGGGGGSTSLGVLFALFLLVFLRRRYV